MPLGHQLVWSLTLERGYNWMLNSRRMVQTSVVLWVGTGWRESHLCGGDGIYSKGARGRGCNGVWNSRKEVQMQLLLGEGEDGAGATLGTQLARRWWWWGGRRVKADS